MNNGLTIQDFKIIVTRDSSKFCIWKQDENSNGTGYYCDAIYFLGKTVKKCIVSEDDTKSINFLLIFKTEGDLAKKWNISNAIFFKSEDEFLESNFGLLLKAE